MVSYRNMCANMSVNSHNDATPTKPTPIGETAECLGCGYRLRGLPANICPECGRGFDPADPTTYRDPGEHRDARRWRRGLLRIRHWQRWSRPPGRVWLAVSSVVILLLIIPLSTPGRSIPSVILVVYAKPWISVAAIAFADYWLAFAALRMTGLIYARARLRRADPKKLAVIPTPRYGRCRLQALVAAVALLTLVYPWPMLIRFSLSRSAFQRAAEARLAAHTADLSSQWIGLYKVNEIKVFTDDQVLFDVDFSPWPPMTFLGEVGFLYEPNGRKWQTPKRLAYLGGDWSAVAMPERGGLW